MENVKKFYDALANNEAMKKKAGALGEKYKGEKPDEAVLKAEIIAFAKTEGFDFTVEDMAEFEKQAKPLSDDELEAVAGGDAGCGCMGAGGGGGKDKNGDTFVCVCAWLGGGDSGDQSTWEFCECVGMGAGASWS